MDQATGKHAYGRDALAGIAIAGAVVVVAIAVPLLVARAERGESGGLVPSLPLLLALSAVSVGVALLALYRVARDGGRSGGGPPVKIEPEVAGEDTVGTETCEIVWWNRARQGGLEARIAGRQHRVAKRSPAVAWKGVESPPPRGPAAKAHGALVERLVADGWEPGAPGDARYAMRFARAAPWPPQVPFDPTMELGSLIALWLRRLPLILLCGALAALGAWFVLAARDDPTLYEEQLSFAVRPSDQVPIETADRVAATLGNRESAITQTLVGLLDSARLPQPTTPETERLVTLRPGSNIVDVTFRGDDPDAVAALADAYRAAAPGLVSRSYRIYELEPLGDGGDPEPVPSAAWRIIVLAAVLASALALAVATVERRVRVRPRDQAGRDRLERGFAGDAGEPVERVGDGMEQGDAVGRADASRIVVVQPEPAPSHSPGRES